MKKLLWCAAQLAIAGGIFWLATGYTADTGQPTPWGVVAVFAAFFAFLPVVIWNGGWDLWHLAARLLARRRAGSALTRDGSEAADKGRRLSWPGTDARQVPKRLPRLRVGQ
jgi:hypothetical protein